MTPKDHPPRGIVYHEELIQGTDEWYAARLGLLTASEMKYIITPGKLQYASNDKERAHLYELAAQRITKYVEPAYVGDEMLRGHFEEAEAKTLYSTMYQPVKNCGFITNDKWGYTLGYSPDGLVGDDALIEVKSRRQKFQVETILNMEAPMDFYIQLQTGLLVSERKRLDFISYCGGMPMFVTPVFPDEKVQCAIINAADEFHLRLQSTIEKFHAVVKREGFLPTERKIFEDITASIGA